MPHRHVPAPRQRDRPQASDIHFLAAQHQIAQLARQAMRVGSALQQRHRRIDPFARALRRRRRREVEHGFALALEKADGFLRQPLDDGAGLAHQRIARQPAQQCRRLRFEGVSDLAAGALRFDLHDRAEALERAFGELAHLAEALVQHPFVGLLFPRHRHAGDLGRALAQHRAVGLGDLLELVGRRLGGFVEARGIGQHRPDFLRRQVEMPMPLAADCRGFGQFPLQACWTLFASLGRRGSAANDQNAFTCA